MNTTKNATLTDGTKSFIYNRNLNNPISKTINAREQKKRNNAKAKNERNARIIKMADENIKRSDIAKEVGVSLRTVQNVQKNSGMVRGYSTTVNVQKSAS